MVGLSHSIPEQLLKCSVHFHCERQRRAYLFRLIWCGFLLGLVLVDCSSLGFVLFGHVDRPLDCLAFFLYFSFAAFNQLHLRRIRFSGL